MTTGVAEKPKPEQLDANIDFYVKVYRKCLDAAEKIAHDKNWGADAVFEMTETIFKQFFSDQTAIAGNARQAKAVVDGMHSVLESRIR